MGAVIRQCASCPWRVGAVHEDIPGYERAKHEELARTIRSGVASLGVSRPAMACHHSEEGADRVCAGWAANQLGPGQNLGLRLHASMEQWEVHVDGLQRRDLQATLDEDDTGAWDAGPREVA